MAKSVRSHKNGDQKTRIDQERLKESVVDQWDFILLGKNKATKGTKLGETIEKTGAFEKLQLY